MRTSLATNPTMVPAGPVVARITPRAITDAYATIIRDACGKPLFYYKPTRGRWVDEAGRRCDGLMAILAARTGREVEPPSGLRELAGRLGLELEYTRGFLMGWENIVPAIGVGPLVTLGWSDGRAAAKAAGLPMGDKGERKDECRGR